MTRSYYVFGIMALMLLISSVYVGEIVSANGSLVWHKQFDYSFRQDFYLPAFGSENYQPWKCNDYLRDCNSPENNSKFSGYNSRARLGTISEARSREFGSVRFFREAHDECFFIQLDGEKGNKSDMVIICRLNSAITTFNASYYGVVTWQYFCFRWVTELWYWIKIGKKTERLVCIVLSLGEAKQK